MSKVYKCKRCKYKTTSKSNYTRHKLSEKHKSKGKKKVTKYVCKTCPYETHDSSNWRRHCSTKKHLEGCKIPDTTYCELCDMSFDSKRIAKVHMYRHYDKTQLLHDIARLKGRVCRLKRCRNKRWLSTEERTTEAKKKEKHRVKTNTVELDNYVRRVKKMEELYKELSCKNCKKKVPKKFRRRDIEIMTEERDKLLDKTEKLRAELDQDQLEVHPEFCRLDEREQWLTQIIIRHKYGVEI